MRPELLYQGLIQVIQSDTTCYLQKGEVLTMLKEDDAWRRAVGEGIDTWDDFLKQPEISISRLEAERMMKAWSIANSSGRSLVDLEQIPVASIKKLTELENITDEILNQAITLSVKDFKEAIAENENIQTRTYIYMVMRKCKETGNMTKVHGIESDFIKETFNINE